MFAFKFAFLSLSYWCNFSIPFIDFFAMLGWAYDLKTVSAEMVKKRVLRTGDGSHRYSKESSKGGKSELIERDVAHFWGWGEKFFFYTSKLF